MSNSITNSCNKRKWWKNQKPDTEGSPTLMLNKPIRFTKEVSNLEFDTEASVVVEIKDDTKRSSDEALGLGAFLHRFEKITT